MDTGGSVRESEEVARGRRSCSKDWIGDK